MLFSSEILLTNHAIRYTVIFCLNITWPNAVHFVLWYRSLYNCYIVYLFIINYVYSLKYHFKVLKLKLYLYWFTTSWIQIKKGAHKTYLFSFSCLMYSFLILSLFYFYHNYTKVIKHSITQACNEPAMFVMHCYNIIFYLTIIIVTDDAILAAQYNSY